MGNLCALFFFFLLPIVLPSPHSPPPHSLSHSSLHLSLILPLPTLLPHSPHSSPPQPSHFPYFCFVHLPPTSFIPSLPPFFPSAFLPSTYSSLVPSFPSPLPSFPSPTLPFSLFLIFLPLLFPHRSADLICYLLIM